MWFIPIVRDIAKQNGYKELRHEELKKMISFEKDSTIINVWYTKCKTGTCINPGDPQLLRDNLTLNQLNQIFEDPTAFVCLGYYK